MKAHLHNFEKRIIVIIISNYPVPGDLGARCIQQEMQKATDHSARSRSFTHQMHRCKTFKQCAEDTPGLFSARMQSHNGPRARYLLSVMEESSCKMLGDGLLCC